MLAKNYFSLEYVYFDMESICNAGKKNIPGQTVFILIWNKIWRMEKICARPDYIYYDLE